MEITIHMKTEFQVEQTIKARYSERTYTEQKISKETLEKINKYIESLSNPFGVKVHFSILEKNAGDGNQKLGTYGVIKGAEYFIGATVEKSLGTEDYTLEGLGYEFEKLILFITSLGLGTCWLGGTFNKSSFASSLKVTDQMIFPAISPFGYPSSKRHFTSAFIRKMAKSDQRLPWETLFFHNSFKEALSVKDAGEYELPLELVRLAPSASNKQPWRIVKDGNTFHFCEAKAPGYSSGFAYDIQKVDLGIAASHFELATLEKGLTGEFKKLETPSIDIPENTFYLFSWVLNS